MRLFNDLINIIDNEPIYFQFLDIFNGRFYQYANSGRLTYDTKKGEVYFIDHIKPDDFLKYLHDSVLSGKNKIIENGIKMEIPEDALS